jgi:hypothetical protein
MVETDNTVHLCSRQRKRCGNGIETIIRYVAQLRLNFMEAWQQSALGGGMVSSSFFYKGFHRFDR